MTMRMSNSNNPATKTTLYEHAGGWEGLYRLSAIFYHKCLIDPILQPLFGHEQPGHVERFTAFTAETFGGPDRFSREMGGFRHLIDAHRIVGLTSRKSNVSDL